jgi:hypothetical protein
MKPYACGSWFVVLGLASILLRIPYMHKYLLFLLLICCVNTSWAAFPVQHMTSHNTPSHIPGIMKNNNDPLTMHSYDSRVDISDALHIAGGASIFLYLFTQLEILLLIGGIFILTGLVMDIVRLCQHKYVMSRDLFYDGVIVVSLLVTLIVAI